MKKIVSPLVDKLKRTSMWNVLWIAIILSELLTAALTAFLCYLIYGRLPPGILLIGVIDAFLVALTVTVIVILIFREYERLEKKAEENKRRIGVLQEREEVSRWLHDNLGSDLFNIILITEMIQQKQVEGKETDEFLDWIADASRNALNNIRSYLNFSEQVGPAVKDLVGYMRDYGQILFRNKRIDFDFSSEISEEAIPLQPMRSFSVYLIYKETITNILKHAHARKVEVRLTEQAGKLLLTVTDDGKGYAAEQRTGEMRGTKNISYRAGMIGGEVVFDSGPGRGTSVRLTVPV